MNSLTTSIIETNKNNPKIQDTAKRAVKLGKFKTYTEALEKVASHPRAWITLVDSEYLKLEETKKRNQKLKAKEKNLTRISPEQERLLNLIKSSSMLTTKTIVNSLEIKRRTIKALEARGLIEKTYTANDSEAWKATSQTQN